MSRTVRIILGIVLALVAVAAVVLIYVYASGGSGEASREISAPTLAPATTVAEAPAEATEAAASAESTPSADATAEMASAASSGPITFNIVPEESQVRFELDEDLRGERITVVGTTNQIAGQLRVDPAQPQDAQVGTIRINVRTLETDNEFRNRAIRGQILLSSQDEFEFTDFVPTAISGLPEQVTVGEPFTFQLTGDLSLRGITQSVTFDVTVTAVSESRLEGSAETTITRDMYELAIPSVPGVANVEEEVLIAIDFVATAA
jgi:polyisoprenoid-binding protein YceI